MKIYTKTGDDGTTGLFGGGRVHKHHPVIETYGTVDELNSLLGVVQTLAPQEPIRGWIHRIQNELFNVGADLSLPIEQNHSLIERISANYTLRLEAEIDEMEAQLKPLEAFILPGGSKVSAYLHLARTVCRRAERACDTTQSTSPINPEILRYLNRLSDWLFCLARFANQLEHIEDVKWKK